MVEGITFIFNKKDKLYVHKSRIEYDESVGGNGFIVIPWFQGFR